MLPWKDLLLVLVLAALFAIASHLDPQDHRAGSHWRVFPPAATASAPNGCATERSTQLAAAPLGVGR